MYVPHPHNHDIRQSHVNRLSGTMNIKFSAAYHTHNKYTSTLCISVFNGKSQATGMQAGQISPSNIMQTTRKPLSTTLNQTRNGMEWFP